MDETEAWRWHRSGAAIDLADENARLRAVLGHCPRCIGVLDEAGALVGYNREFAGLFASAPPLGASIEVLFDEPRRAILRQVIAAAGTEHRAAAIIPIFTTGGTEREVEFLVATLPGADAHSLGVVLAAEDRTARTHEEGERMMATRTIEGANRNGAIDFAQASLCHDVNNAMTAAALSLAALERHSAIAEPSAHALVVQLGEAVQQATDVVTRVRALAQAGVRARSGVCSVRDCVERARALVAPLACRAHVDLTVAAGVADDCTVRMSETELAQVVTNLMINAVHAVEDAKRSGQVRVTAEKGAAQTVRISVHDDGVGIEPSHLVDSFDAFETTRASRGGTGLGLAIARGLVEGIGGRIDVFTTPGVGTDMTIELPEAAAVVDDAAV
jgi:signal transduction histidine kinase